MTCIQTISEIRCKIICLALKRSANINRYKTKENGKGHFKYTNDATHAIF